ncbi:hypothetical protein F5B20DRAFT_373895 [Whalleya microplaca]|nr:hypothetical protein F5B20DRAFT_373895 [Whalleya microplaca]
MQQVACACMKCKRHLGELLNLWTQIGKSYISPIVPSETGLRITPSGSARLGDKQTLVDSCQLQDVACARCRTVIGLQLTDTPINHVLHKGQLFLRSSSLIITDLEGGDVVQPTIQRTLKLKEATRNGVTTGDTPTDSRDDLHSFQRHTRPSSEGDQINIDHLQAEVQRLDQAGYQMLSSFNNAVLRTDGEVEKLKNGVSDLQQNLTSTYTNTLGIEKDIVSLKSELKQTKKIAQGKPTQTYIDQEILSAKQIITDTRLSLSSELEDAGKEHQRRQETLQSELDHARQELKEMKEDLDSVRSTARESISTARAYAKDVISLKAELKQLREEVARDRSRKSPPNDPVFPAREIDILTSSITKIGQRAGHIESLQMEFELLKGRVQRLEARTPTSRNDSDIGHLHINSSTPRQGRHGKRSRSHEHADTSGSETSAITPLAKRQLPDRGIIPSSPINCDSIFSPPSIGTHKPDIELRESPRLTKSGAVDKRYLKRGLRGARREEAKSRVSNG